MDENRVQLIYFEICGEKFAFNMEYLVEIVEATQSEITPFFSPVPMIRGMWDYRGNSLYVIDLRDFFGLEKLPGGKIKDSQVSFESRPYYTIDSFEGKDNKNLPKSILVINIRGKMFGLLTDTVLQVVPLIDLYEYPDMISTLPKKYFAGVTLIDSELVLLLAIQEFINEYELDALLSQKENSENLVHQSTD